MPNADGSATTRATMRLPQATAMVVGVIIGASIFVQPSEVATQVHTTGSVLLVWLSSGVLTLAGALVCAELSSTFTRTGGVYLYLSEAFHPSVGFAWGWAMLVTMHSGILAAIATIFARYVAWFIPLSPNEGTGVAIALIALLSAVNYAGVRYGSRVQTLFTAGKLLAVLLIILLGVSLGGRRHVAAAEPSGDTVGGFLRAMVAGLFAFGGWHMVTYSSEETVESRRTIPRALIIGTLIVTAAYLAMNAVYLYVLPLATVARSTRVAADFADALLTRGGGTFMAAIVLVSTIGAANGVTLAGPRVYFAMARDGLLFRSLGELHPRFGTPHRALVLQGVWASILVATGSFRALFSRVVYTEWIFFGLLAIGLIVVRRRPDVRRRYSIPGYPVVPLLFAAASFAVVGNAVVSNPRDAALGLSIVFVAFPMYWILFRGRRTATDRPAAGESAE